MFGRTCDISVGYTFIACISSQEVHGRQRLLEGSPLLTRRQLSPSHEPPPLGFNPNPIVQIYSYPCFALLVVYILIMVIEDVLPTIIVVALIYLFVRWLTKPSTSTYFS